MRRRWWLGLAALPVALSACGEGGPAAPGAAPPDAAPPDRVLVGLCQAQAADGFDEASRHFDRVHGPLHQLAADIGEEDREVAGRLHRAKAALERSVTQDDTAAFDQALSELVSATQDSLEELGRPAPACSDLPADPESS